MDAFILLGSFIMLILLGMPVAYALGLSALIGAWWIDIPLQAMMIQVASGNTGYPLLQFDLFLFENRAMLLMDHG